MNAKERQIKEVKKILARKPRGLELGDVDKVLDRTWRGK